MAPSAFFDKELPPTDRQVVAILGPMAPLWEFVQAKIAEQIADVRASWTFTANATGWSLRLKQGERILVDLTPTDGCFYASLALNERAVAAARTARLSTSLITIIDAAPVYARERGIRFPVKTPSDAANVVKLAVITAAL